MIPDEIDKKIIELEREIETVRDQLDPASKDFRYRSMLLEILTLRRDVMNLEDERRRADHTVAVHEQRLEILEMKNNLLSLALTALCKPEARHWLAIAVCEKMTEKLEKVMQ